MKHIEQTKCQTNIDGSDDPDVEGDDELNRLARSFLPGYYVILLLTKIEGRMRRRLQIREEIEILRVDGLDRNRRSSRFQVATDQIRVC